jgi:hypothetical protein
MIYELKFALNKDAVVGNKEWHFILLKKILKIQQNRTSLFKM